MQNGHLPKLPRVLNLFAVILILKVTASIVLAYRNYFPPNFESEFLRGRQSYFSGSYQWAFYPHIIFGPTALVLGLILLSERFRSRFPKWHRLLGKTQIIVVLCLLAPTGLWMARYAETGAVAAAGFAGLAIGTGLCAIRLAIRR